MRTRAVVLCLFLLLVSSAVLVPRDTRAQDRPLNHCAEPTATAFLDINNVRARVLNSGKLIWDGDRRAVHEFPRGSGLSTAQMTSLWLSSKYEAGHRAVMTSSNLDPYRPGPHDVVAAGESCRPFDRIFTVGVRDLAALDNGAQPATDVQEWPWELGAPVKDGDGIADNYNLAGGDRPLLLGDETHWWIVTDKGGGHLPRAGTLPIGLEVHGMAAASAADGFENATFYQYRIINKSGMTLDSLFLGLQHNFRIGGAWDDFIGVDTTLSLAYGYNADNDDEGGYGPAPPAVGVQFLDRPMTSHIWFEFHGDAQGRPRFPVDVWNLLRARWPGGEVVREGGAGTSTSGTVTRFALAGDPVERDFWSQMNADGAGNMDDPSASRLSLSGSGPYSLAPNDEISLTFALVNARGSDHLDSITALRNTAETYRSMSFEDIPTSGRPLLGPTPVVAPRIAGVADGARRQPVDLTLRYNTVHLEIIRMIRGGYGCRYRCLCLVG